MASKIGENINSSESWVSRSGVVVGYQPEDTMKSFIFNENNRHCLKLNNDNLMNLMNFPQSEIDRALELLSSDDDSDSSSITKNTIKNGWSGAGELRAEAEKLPGDMSRHCEQKVLSWCTNEENDSTSADLSSDLCDQELEKDVITVSDKSFEEILNSKLQEEKINNSEKSKSKAISSSKPKFSFLRKNSGKAAWSSNVKRDGKHPPIRSLSHDRETIKTSNDPPPNSLSLRRMKSMPTTSKTSALASRNPSEKPLKTIQKTVHFAERSDHETSTETIDQVKLSTKTKIDNHKKENIDKRASDETTNDEVDKELVEFELLEQIANVSISSTASSIAKFDEDMLREKILNIQRMPPPNTHFQNEYVDDKSNQSRKINGEYPKNNNPGKLSTCDELVEDLQDNSAYGTEHGDESASDCSNSTTLSHFNENIASISERNQCSGQQKLIPTRKVSKQDDRQKTHYAGDNDDSWIDDSPFQMTARSSERIQQTQNNSANHVAPVKWTFADPFHQSDLSSDEESSQFNPAIQPREKLAIGNIFPSIMVDKKQANPDDNVSIQSAKLKQWVQLLETEIKRFNKENEEISKIKAEQEQGLKRMEHEMNEFSKHKEEEMKQFEDYKQRELKKLKKERKVFEEYQEAMKNMPNKKDREEIDRLKSEIESLKEESVSKESRWQSANTRLKQKIEQLEADNSDMRTRIHGLEQKRLQLQAQLISNPCQTVSKSSESTVNKHVPKPTVTSVSQAISMKHTNVPIPIAPAKEDNNSNKFVNTPRIPVQIRKPVNKTQNVNSKVVRAAKRPDSDRIDVRGSAASDYYTGEDESGSTDSHQNGTTAASTLQDNVPAPVVSGGGLGGRNFAKINRSTDFVKEEMRHQDGILERVYMSGGVDVIYPNGSLKQISADGKSIIIHLFNGDVKQITPDGRIIYFYSQDESTQTTFSDGKEEILYKSGQKEVIHPSGIREVHFPDQSIKILHPDSREENILPNGLIIRLNGAGDKEIILPNGQKEIHSNGIKKRIYPDGTTKTVYSDGRQETYYASGRMRVKDKNGTLILDQYIDKVMI